MSRVLARAPRPRRTPLLLPLLPPPAHADVLIISGGPAPPWLRDTRARAVSGCGYGGAAIDASRAKEPRPTAKAGPRLSARSARSSASPNRTPGGRARARRPVIEPAEVPRRPRRRAAPCARAADRAGGAAARTLAADPRCAASARAVRQARSGAARRARHHARARLAPLAQHELQHGVLEVLDVCGRLAAVELAARGGGRARAGGRAACRRAHRESSRSRASVRSSAPRASARTRALVRGRERARAPGARCAVDRKRGRRARRAECAAADADATSPRRRRAQARARRRRRWRRGVGRDRHRRGRQRRRGAAAAGAKAGVAGAMTGMGEAR